MADTVSMALAELVRKAEQNGDVDFLRDGVRVLSRAIRRSKPLVQAALAGARDAFRTRLRTVRRN